MGIENAGSWTNRVNSSLGPVPDVGNDPEDLEILTDVTTLDCHVAGVVLASRMPTPWMMMGTPLLIWWVYRLPRCAGGEFLTVEMK